MAPPACRRKVPGTLTLGQQRHGINWLAEAAYFEVKLHLIGVRLSHLRDFLPLRDCLPFLHEKLVVMGVNAQESVIVLYYDEFSESPDPGPAEYDPTRGAGIYRLPELSGNTDAL